jgi:hypothetical protein
MRHRVLTITLEFELVERKAYQPRLAAAYKAAVEAAAEAVNRQLLPNGVAGFKSRVCYDTRTFDSGYEEYTFE